VTSAQLNLARPSVVKRIGIKQILQALQDKFQAEHFKRLNLSIAAGAACFLPHGNTRDGPCRQWELEIWN
jgi:hypothetical protein